MFFFKQKTAYEMRISDWSSDVCSSDLVHGHRTDIQPISADHGHGQTRNADIEDRHGSSINEAQPHPLAGAKEAGPVFLRSMTIHEVSVGGGRHIGDVGGVHPHLSPHRAVGGGHALFGTTTQHTEQRTPLAIEIDAPRLWLGSEPVRLR